MNKLLASVALITLITGGISGIANAQTTDTTTDPGHPRVNEINQRLDNQQNRTNAGVQDGQINGNQAAHDETRDAHVQKEESRDEAKNGGTLTTHEQNKMNRQLNRNSKHIHRQRAAKPAAAP